MDEDIVHLYIDGELIETTAEHPFYTDEGEWVDAAELEVGESILSLDGDTGTVENVVVVEDVFQPMYNLTVDEAHTFFIGGGDWLVHNCDPVDIDNLRYNYFDGDFEVTTGREPILKGPRMGVTARYRDGELDQITLYNHNGDAVYQIDRPDTNSNYWHFHDFADDPGNPLSGHPHEGAPPKVGNSISDVENFLQDLGIANIPEL